MSDLLFIANDNVLELSGLQNTVTDEYLNGATVTVTVYETDGTTEVTGQSWPTAMGYVAASNGVYRATLENDLALAEGERYVARVTADGGAGLVMSQDFMVTAVRRRA